MKSSILLAIILLTPFTAFAMDTARIVDLVNAERAERGLQEVVISETLNQVAADKAQDMLNEQYFAHSNDGDIWQFFRANDYNFRHAGEVLAIHHDDEETLVQAWMDSAPHKATLVNSVYRETGIAQIGTVTVQVFGTQVVKQLPDVQGVQYRFTEEELAAKQCLL